MEGLVTIPKVKGNRYFTRDADIAIVQYNRTKDYKVKEQIYHRHIHYPFFKLTQNIIHTFKFYYTDVRLIEHLQQELIVFLLSKIHMFNPARSVEKKINLIFNEGGFEIPEVGFLRWIEDNDMGEILFKKKDIKKYLEEINAPSELNPMFNKINIPKAYSYFGTITKRYLITYNNKNYEKLKLNESIEKYDDFGEDDLIKTPHQLIQNYENVDTGSELDYFTDHFIKYCKDNLKEIFNKELDQQIANAILEIFKERENLEVFNKKALYIYIREMIDVQTPKITNVVNILKKIFYKNYHHYIEYNYVDFKH